MNFKEKLAQIKTLFTSAYVGTNEDENKLKLKESFDSLASLDADYNTALSTVPEASQKQINELTAKVTEMETAATASAEIIKSLTEDLAMATKAGQILATEKDTLVTEHEAALAQVNETVTSLEAENKTLTAANKKLSGKTKQTRKEITSSAGGKSIIEENDKDGKSTWENALKQASAAPVTDEAEEVETEDFEEVETEETEA